MAWLRKGENRPQIPCRELSTKKMMVVPFFDQRGLIHLELVENQTVNKHVFLAILKRARMSLQNRRGSAVWLNRAEYLLHMDNAPAHRSKLVQDYLRDENWNQMKHPPYSPDLSPANFFLFPRLKKHLRGIRFPNTEPERKSVDQNRTDHTRRVGKLFPGLDEALPTMCYFQWKLFRINGLKSDVMCLVKISHFGQ